MTEKSWFPLNVRMPLKNRLMALWEEDKKKGKISQVITFNSYIDDKLTGFVEVEENLRKRGAFLEFRDAVEDHVLLFDNYLNKPIVLTIRDKDKSLYCEQHKGKDCIHVGFCYAIGKVYRMLVDRDFIAKKRS